MSILTTASTIPSSKPANQSSVLTSDYKSRVKVKKSTHLVSDNTKHENKKSTNKTTSFDNRNHDSQLFNSNNNIETTKEAGAVKERLLREISCLERQLARLKKQTFNAQKPVLETYEQMIQVRHEMLGQFD